MVVLWFQGDPLKHQFSKSTGHFAAILVQLWLFPTCLLSTLHLCENREPIQMAPLKHTPPPKLGPPFSFVMTHPWVSTNHPSPFLPAETPAESAVSRSFRWRHLCRDDEPTSQGAAVEESDLPGSRSVDPIDLIDPIDPIDPSGESSWMILLRRSGDAKQEKKEKGKEPGDFWMFGCFVLFWKTCLFWTPGFEGLRVVGRMDHQACGLGLDQMVVQRIPPRAWVRAPKLAEEARARDVQLLGNTQLGRRLSLFTRSHRRTWVSAQTPVERLCPLGKAVCALPC